MENEVMYIKLDDIIPNRFQPREVFDEDALNKLAESIKQHGVIEPILVRPVSNKYEIVAGERRYKASVIAGLTKIPAMVRQMDDKESSIVAFIENEHRTDVSAIEEARTMDRILKNNNMTQEELAKELGVNQSTIANKLRLLNLPLEVQESLMHNEISERHARSLLSVKDEDKQIELLNRIKERKMTVRELDSEIKNMNENINNFNEPRNNFMGQFPSGNPMPNVGVEKEASTGFNPSDYFNTAATPTPPVAPAAPQASGPADAGFMDFLNNYDNNNPVPNEPTSPSPAAVQANGPADAGFMDFLNNYDNNNPVPNEPVGLKEQAPTATPEGNDFRNMLNSYENPAPAPAPTNEPADAGFMDFLNNYDNNNPVPAEPTSPAPAPAPTNEPADAGFMSFLNNYDNNNPLPAEEAPKAEPADAGFMNYLNNYDNNNPLPAEPAQPVAQDTFSYDVPEKEAGLYDNFNSTNNVTPPVNANNQYVENNANFVDVSKQNKITSVDEIINKVGAVVKEIKEKSVFKIDTEEINYDDLYQITIKIDKRDF